MDLYNFDFEAIEDLSYLFYGCNSLTSINLSYINTFSTTNMEYMFYGCNSLIELNLKDWITSSVLNINSMFYDCISLISLDLSNFDTSLVTNMKDMFYNCIKITSINLNNFNTENVKDFQSIFGGCISLLSLNLFSFETFNALNMQSMFYNCKKLTLLDLSNFNTQNTIKMDSMFFGCSNLAYINFKNYNDKSLTNIQNMFLETPDNLIICINNIKDKLNKEMILSELYKLKCPSLDCSDNWEKNKKKIIYSNGNCIDNCKNESYKYEYDFYCYEECPIGTHTTKNNKYLCEKNIDKCLKKTLYINIEDNSCLNDCNSIDFFNEKCTLNEHNSEGYNILVNNIIKDIKNNSLNQLISNVLNE